MHAVVAVVAVMLHAVVAVMLHAMLKYAMQLISLQKQPLQSLLISLQNQLQAEKLQVCRCNAAMLKYADAITVAAMLHAILKYADAIKAANSIQISNNNYNNDNNSKILFAGFPRTALNNQPMLQGLLQPLTKTVTTTTTPTVYNNNHINNSSSDNK
jgi:hypothetical protein